MGKTYETYKDSGIPWIGEIPEGWEVMKIKRVLKNKSEKGHPNETILSLYRDYGVIPKDSRDDNHNVTSEDTGSYKYVEIGNFVINKMKSWQGSMAVSSYSGIISPAYYVCMFTRNDIEKKYIHYLLRNESYKTEYLRLSTGMRIGQWDLNIESFLNIEMILPPLSEQQSIASYLDEKCADIDELVSLQEEMIKELEAYKQSIITEAVTKGLDPNVPMKDSGIEWIGEIPSGWVVCRMKNVTTCNDDTLSESVNPEQIIRYVEIGDVSSMNGITNVTTYKFKDSPSRARRVTQKGDVIVSTVRTYLRAISRINEENLIVSTGFAVLRPKNYDSSYLAYFSSSEVLINMIIAISTGISYPAVNPSQIMSLPVICPSLIEQQAIASYLDEKCADIDAIISLRKKKIEELKEYKKSVIFEAVTGKIKVV